MCFIRKTGIWNVLERASNVFCISCVLLEDGQVDQNILQWILCLENNKNVVVSDGLLQYNLCHHKRMFVIKVSPAQLWSYFCAAHSILFILTMVGQP